MFPPLSPYLQSAHYAPIVVKRIKEAVWSSCVSSIDCDHRAVSIGHGTTEGRADENLALSSPITKRNENVGHVTGISGHVHRNTQNAMLKMTRSEKQERGAAQAPQTRLKNQ
jgi:hypothetical protein